MAMAIGFTGNPLDRGDHLRGDADAVAALAGDARARLVKLHGTEPVIDDAGRLVWSSLAGRTDGGALVFLGLDEGGRPHFTEYLPGVPGLGGARSAALSRLLDGMAGGDAAIFGTARHLIDWLARHRFCSVCGAATELMRAGWGRRCGRCSAEHFPRIDPVVIMIAEHSGRALVGRGTAWPERRYSALAGFVEPGESIEEAVARELFEEAGVRVRNVRYLASQPWPFPGQLMIACTADAEDDALVVDARELADAMWVTVEEVRAALAGEPAPFLAPPPYAIAHSLLAAWAAG